MSGLTIALLLLASFGPACRHDSDEPLRQALLGEINAARDAAGQQSLEVHPALCEIAAGQADAVAKAGGTSGSSQYITDTTRRLYRAGYAAHKWTEGSLIGTSDDQIWSQWRGVRPEWCAEIETGDFEDVGIGLARHRGRLVMTLVLALKTRTVEWRQAEPLSELASVRATALAVVNEARRDQGREAVKSESRLDAAAQRFAEDMLRRAYYDHTSPEGETVRERVRATGYRGARTLSENIAKGLFAPDEVVRRWLNSSGHRRNILRRSATETGLGVAFGENANGFEVVWVQVFASR